MNSDVVFRLEGGNEDNDLWIQRAVDNDGAPVLVSVWQPNDHEREAIAAGANIELVVWGSNHAPVGVGTTDVQLGRRR